MLCLSVSQHFIRLSKHSCKLEELSSEPHLSTTGLCHDRLATLLFLAFACADPNKLWEILREMGIPGHLTCLLRISMQVRKQQLELDMEQQTGSK